MQSTFISPASGIWSRAGFAVHWLHPKSNRPIGKNWASVPVVNFRGLQKSYRDRNNVGVRLGKWSKVDCYYLHVVDADIRVSAEIAAALVRLSELFPDWREYPTVQSGSHGESRHFYILSEQPFSSKKLAHNGKKFKDAQGKEHWTWEIELFGTGKQVAMPPSIHPDSGKPYRWLREFDFDEVSLGFGPVVDARYPEELVGAEDDIDDLFDDGDDRRTC